MSAKKTIAIGLFALAIIYGGVQFFAKNSNDYSMLSGVTFVSPVGRNIEVIDYAGFNTDNLGLKMRGCFSVGPGAFEGVGAPLNPAPITLPDWFVCFDPEPSEADLAAGVATAYLAAVNEKDGFDRVVAVYPDGRAYQWRQLNDKYQE